MPRTVVRGMVRAACDHARRNWRNTLPVRRSAAVFRQRRRLPRCSSSP